MKRNARTGFIPVLFFLVLSAFSQADAQFVVRQRLIWRTIETEHFAFHYPEELEAWTFALARRAESIDTAVARIVGYAPPRKTQVVVDDPFQAANGMAWPFLDQPGISLWAFPPTPRDEIGEYRDWGEMLFSHEFAHIAHLTRPTRNPLLAELLNSLPVKFGPLALRSPRWVIEGYATFVEGRATGSGRPHGVWRAAVLRQWALEGQLPRYHELNMSGAYEGGAFAYLVGSAFMEWLARTHGDSSLVNVWRRLSAKVNRTFDEAFAGVYGESAATLYGRFTAELTGKSLEVARAIAATPDTGEIVQRLTRTTGDPAISPDGQRVALVTRSATAPSRVVVWRTATEPDTMRRRRDSLLIAADPEDVPARPIYPPPKRVLASLRSAGGAPYESPRFLRDGRILLSRNTARGDGSMAWDLYLWNPSEPGVQRITSGAGVNDADPLPDGRSALATRCRRGWCDLVSVTLADGAVTSLIAGSAEHSFYHPRVSPGGTRAIVSVHRDGRWQLATVDLATRALSIVDLPDGANRYDAAWLDSNEVVTTSERGGIPNIERIDLGTLQIRQIAHETGAAVAPEPNPVDKSVWFLSLHARGYDVRRASPAQVERGAPLASVAIDARVIPALSPRPDNRPEFAANPISEPRSFGFAPRLFRWIPQPSLDADGASGALSLVSRDLIGRSEVGATFAYGSAAAWRGGSLTALWLGTAPGIRVQAFAAQQELGRSWSNVVLQQFLDARLGGVDVALDDNFQFETWAARYRVGGSIAQWHALSPAAEANGLVSAARALAVGDGAIAWVQRGDQWSFSESLSGNLTLGRSIGTSVQRGLGTASLSSSGRATIFPIVLSGSYGRVNRDAPVYELFALGGGPSLLIDRALLSQRIVMPVLPAGIRIGSSVVSYRASVVTRPVAWYFWAGSTSLTDRFHHWQRVIGVDWSMSIPASPPVGTPAARAQIGIGKSLDVPFRHRVRGYVSLVLNP